MHGNTGKKWCNTAPESWVILDTKGLYRIFGFRIYDCNSGPEKGDNISDYTISLSDDCETWTTVVREKDCQNIKLKEDYIAPVTARYIRLDAKVKNTLRIWEFEALGIDEVNMTFEADPASIRLMAGEQSEITVRYILNGDERADNFKCSATALDRSLVTVGAVTEDAGAATFTIPVTAGSKIGESAISVRIDNGSSYVEHPIKVTVDVPDARNALAGMDAEVRHYNEDYTPSATFTGYKISGLTDGDTSACALEESIETPSTHTDDLWAIFDAGDKPFNLAKVKVFLPYANKAENDNGKQGFVNKEISIAIGDNLASLTRVKTFANLEEAQELEYIFPSSVTARYLAIVCDLNVYFYPALAEIEAYEQVEGAAEASDGPIAMNGWKMDIVAEAIPSKEHTTESFYSNRVFFTSDVQKDGALCDANGIITTGNGTTYRIDPAGNNAILAQGSGKELTFAEPISCSSISILAARTQNFGDPLNISLVYTDGTKSTETHEIESYNSSAAAAVTASPISRNTDEISGHYRFYEMTLTADPEKTLSKIEFKTMFDKYYIFGVSGKGKMSGIASINAAVTHGDIEAIYNMLGVQVKHPTKGIYLVRYTDGTVVKMAFK